MEFLTNLWNNQPSTVMGIGIAIFILLGFLYLYSKHINKLVNYFFNFF